MTSPIPETEREAPHGEEGPGAAVPRRAPLDASGMERPRFLLDFPEDPGLERLIEAFERGDYAFVRQHAEKVAAAAENPDVREAALELRRRIEPDPLAKYLLAASVCLLVFLAIWAYAAKSH